MSKDIHLIVKILAAVKKAEDKQVFDIRLIDDKVIGCSAEKRDRIAIKLQKAGYIDGLCIIDGIDNMQYPVVMWNNSRPEITIAGIEYMESNDTFKKALKEIKNTGVQIATSTLSNAIFILGE